MLQQYAPIPKRLVIIEKAASLDEVEALAASYEPKIAKALIKAIELSADEIDLDELAQALAGGNLEKVLAMLKIQLGPASDVLQDAVIAGAVKASANLPINKLEWHFNRLNPVLIDWLQSYSFGLVREMGKSMIDAVRGQLTEGMRLGLNPRTQARTIKAIIGLTDRQAMAVYNFRKELEGFHARRTGGGYGLGQKIDRVNGAQVLKPGADGTPKDGITERRLRDFRYDKQLLSAVHQSKPLTPEQIDKMVDAYARKYRKYRAETIARTESMRAVNMGTQEAWRQAVQDGKVVEDLIRRTWKVAHDERLCPVCEPIPDMNLGGVKLAQPFATPKGPTFLPPMHPDCRCHVFIRVLEPEQVK